MLTTVNMKHFYLMWIKLKVLQQKNDSTLEQRTITIAIIRNMEMFLKLFFFLNIFRSASIPILDTTLIIIRDFKVRYMQANTTYL